MSDVTIISAVTEKDKDLFVHFTENEEVHVGMVYSVNFIDKKGIYFKVTEVTTGNCQNTQVIAKEYGCRKKAGKIDVRRLVQCYLQPVTDEDTLEKLKKESSWL